MNIINIIGLLFAVTVLALHAKLPLRREEARATAASVVRGIGFYGSLFLLGFNLGILELDTESGNAGSVDFVELFWIWAALGLLLTGAYVWVHLLVAKKGRRRLYFVTVLLTFLLFFLSALLRGHILEFPFALLWLGGHIPMLFHKDSAPNDGQEKEGE
jgi:cytochrome bd-type quinol oxidase subunit 2